MKKIILPISICVSLALCSCLKEDDMKEPYRGFTPVDISDGWIISDPAAENMDSIGLDKIFRDVYVDDNNWMMKSLLVFRNGKLVAECYLKDEADRTKMDAIWSCTKQVNSIITGIALDQGYINSINDSIAKYLPEYIERFPDKKGILIKDLLTMKSGIDFDNGKDNDLLKQHKVNDITEYILSRDLVDQPGTTYNYKDSDPQLLSAIVQKATGKPLDEFGKEVLFDRLGITNYYWHRYSDGVTMGAWGILTTPRELAKVAQCILDSGRCNKQQVIPPDWLQEMLSVQIPDADGELAFGYLWWSIPSMGWYFTRGHGGQFAFIIPSKKLLVVITSLPNVDDDCSLPIEYHIGLVEKIVKTTL
jgi:CubicO group peptidase (beta-lactamase class C family)